jgi:uncharacterized protein (TIGR02588 family)
MSQEDNPQQQQEKGEQSKERTAAEWITLGVSVLIVLALAGLVIYQELARGTEPPVIEVMPRLGETRHEGDAYYVPIDVTNKGETTAEDIEVQLSLEAGEGQPEVAAFTLKFLAGAETESQTVVFQNDPSKGKLTHVVAFSVP